ncbi:SDR family NAD(P)-dependent oxidoreductase [Govanella unica]|uniref:SDR family NAD(P)-dependent oxidoreductase n=1 Tax=Govanella unica TaxID=2975056 RepID=A0A9X3Z7K0_9PROT|nr:SDR family NAD(P)-dependent oxidoreductase [Govania unica]MDA5194059.1 SDR family NAD(P)-dependent oxidoreductase [Govania unica]
MSFDLSGKTAFVTGATSGLGRQFARVLSAAGAAVVISGRRMDRLEALAAEIRAAGGRAHPLQLDMMDVASFPAAIEAAEQALGPIWILVNNSGVAVNKSILDHTEEDYDGLMDTNVKGVYFLAQAAARSMIAKGDGGRIINIASIGALKVLGGTSVYCVSKAAVAHMTKCMALEWARFDINVNAICPGYIRTEMNDAFFNSPAGEKLINRFPRRRLGKEDDLDGLLLLLASRESSYITGAVMTADDGQVLA